MEKSVLLGTKPLVDSTRHFIRDPSGVFSVCHLCECRIVQWLHDSRLLLLLNWFLLIIKRTLHVGSKIWILCSRGKNTNIKFISSRHRVISSIYFRAKWRLSFILGRKFFSIQQYAHSLATTRSIQLFHAKCPSGLQIKIWHQRVTVHCNPQMLTKGRCFNDGSSKVLLERPVPLHPIRKTLSIKLVATILNFKCTVSCSKNSWFRDKIQNGRHNWVVYFLSFCKPTWELPVARVASIEILIYSLFFKTDLWIFFFTLRYASPSFLTT